MPEQPFARIAILGLGAMGGSLARGLARLDAAPSVVGWSPDREERDAAREAGVVVEAPAEPREAVANADLVVLATPLRATCDLLGTVADASPPGSTLSDVASLKAPVARAVAEAGVQDRWVGSHPMTGSEESGFAASRADLYSGAKVWTVAYPGAADRVRGVHDFWVALGARPEAIDAEEHDRLMTLVSHLPQLTSNALARVLAEGGVPHRSLGPGGLDMTRLAASGAAMWRDILEHASPELLRGLRDLADASSKLADMLEAGDLEGIGELMNATRSWSRSE